MGKYFIQMVISIQAGGQKIYDLDSESTNMRNKT